MHQETYPEGVSPQTRHAEQVRKAMEGVQEEQAMRFSQDLCDVYLSLSLPRLSLSLNNLKYFLSDVN